MREHGGLERVPARLGRGGEVGSSCLPGSLVSTVWTGSPSHCPGEGFGCFRERCRGKNSSCPHPHPTAQLSLVFPLYVGSQQNNAKQLEREPANWRFWESSLWSSLASLLIPLAGWQRRGQELRPRLEPRCDIGLIPTTLNSWPGAFPSNLFTQLTQSAP